jgi:hypothetical protein
VASENSNVEAQDLHGNPLDVQFPETKSKETALDGVEFNIYVQRMGDDVYVGAYAIDIKDKEKFVVFNAEPLQKQGYTLVDDTTTEDSSSEGELHETTEEG